MITPLTPHQVAARLDRLPVGRFHYRFLGLISLGAWFDYYDNFVAGTLAVVLPLAGVLPETKKGDWVSALGDRKSTRLNSSHQIISYAVFCLKKKKLITQQNYTCAS